MLVIKTPEIELFNEYTLEFLKIPPQELHLEHSLLSISKWESRWEKPFFDSDEEINKSNEELTDYIRCMTINSNVNPMIYNCMPADSLNKIYKYMNSKATATRITKNATSTKKNSEGITSELIYYWMTAFNIPFEAQKWHINRLLMLIEICSIKNQPEKKMSRTEQMKRQHEINEARKRKLKTSG